MNTLGSVESVSANWSSIMRHPLPMVWFSKPELGSFGLKLIIIFVRKDKALGTDF